MPPSEAATLTSTQKRARQQLSCTACRTGKLKCDRQQPCDQCIKRSKDSLCQYLAPPPKKKLNRNTKERIAHLEGLVVQLMNKDGSIASSSDSIAKDSESTNGKSDRSSAATTHSEPSVDSRASPSSGSESVPDSSDIGFGQLKISHGQTEYKGASHWESILESIADVKAAMDDDGDSEDSGDEDEGLDSASTFGLLGISAFITREYLLECIPARPVADRLLWQWFNSSDPALPLIHRPTFLAEYEQFWREPTKTPTMWLAMFFGMLCLGSRITSILCHADQEVPKQPGIKSADQFQQLAASALQLAGFIKPKKYTMEAMIMYGSCEFAKREDDGMRLWYIISIISRVALRMGYHRDPDHFPNITPFEGEISK